MEPTLTLRLAQLVASMVNRAAAPRPGAYSVTDPVPMGGRLRGRRPAQALGEKDFTRLVATLGQRLADLERRFAELTPEVGTAVLAAVAAALGTQVTMSDVQEADLDPVLLRARLTRGRPLAAAPYPDAAVRLADELMDACCAQIIEYFTGRPEFVSRTLLEHTKDLGELLRRSPPVLEDGDRAFAERYAVGIKRHLDQAEVLGVVEIQPEESNYRLTTAYVNLTLHTVPEPRGTHSDRRRSPVFDPAHGQEFGNDPVSGPLETMLQNYPRLVLEGPAGSGKTTLLRRLAVHIIDGDLPLQLADWRGRVPFLVRIRGLLHDGRLSLPSTAGLARETGSLLGDDEPPGWATRLLRAGEAVLLVDGLDEVPQEHHADILDWLHRLCTQFPEAAYVLTSRPHVLSRNGRRVLREIGFGTAELQAMNRANVSDFIARWHQTQALASDDADTSELLEEYGRDLDRLLDTRRDLARLATNPLLCALICALHRGADRALPEGRTALYRTALAMMLGSRERARKIAADGVRLDPGQREKLLGILAMSMTLNGRRSISRDMAVQRIEACLPWFATRQNERPYDARVVLQHLQRRSGLLQEPVVDVLEFRHASFQDYLAAGEMVQTGHIEHLLRSASDPLYHDVLIMAVSRAQGDEELQQRLLDGVIGRAEAAGEDGRQLWLLAAACIADVGMVPPESAARIHQATRELIPPTGREDAQSLALAGEFVLDLLADTAARRHLSEPEALSTIYAGAAVGTDAAIPLLRTFRHRPEPQIRQALAQAWRRIPDVERYMTDVIAETDLSRLTVELPDVRLLHRPEPLRRVRHIKLPGDTREFPAEQLAALNHLMGISVADTQITDLRTIRSMPSVIALDLGNTEVVDIKPVRRLENLTWLSLAHTRVADIAPLELTRLKWLFLSFTQVGDARPLRGLTELIELSLHETRVLDVSPIGQVRQLQRLNLGGTRVRDVSALGDLAELTHLDLSGTLVSDLRPLATLRHLRHLNLAGTPVIDLEPLAGLTALRALNLANTQVISVGPLGRLTEMTDLSLAGTGIVSLAPLTAMRQLAWLNIGRTWVTDIRPVTGLPLLERIDLTAVPVSDLRPLVAMPGLVVVNQGRASDHLPRPRRGRPRWRPGRTER